MSMSKPDETDKDVISARVDPKLKHRAKVVAAIRDETLSDYVAALIREDLEGRDLPISDDPD
jgi:antitoxin component of RelBE/YafQ-DinJ toxin-antitoxin module